MRIALIHAVPVAILPVEDAFQRHWPQAERINLLDDALSVDRNRAGASGILYTCSAFGYAIEAVKQRVRMPVLKPNEAMFAEAIARGSRLGLLATFPASVNSMARGNSKRSRAARRASRRGTRPSSAIATSSCSRKSPPPVHAPLSRTS